MAIPRALLDPGFGQVLRQVGPLQRARAIGARLKKFRECRALPDAEFDALVQSVSVIGFMFGFMRPAVLAAGPENLHQDRLCDCQTSCPQPVLRRPGASAGAASGTLTQLAASAASLRTVFTVAGAREHFS